MKKLLVSLLLVAALPLAAQHGPGGPGPGPGAGPGPVAGGPPPGGPGGPPGGGPPPEQVLKEVLGLTDDQLTAIHNAAESRRAGMEALAHQLGDAQKALGTALGAATPDPTAVGTALLAIQSIQKQLEAAAQGFGAAVAAILTPEQKAKVEQIHGVEAALRAADALHRLGL